MTGSEMAKRQKPIPGTLTVNNGRLSRIYWTCQFLEHIPTSRFFLWGQTTSTSSTASTSTLSATWSLSTSTTSTTSPTSTMSTMSTTSTTSTSSTSSSRTGSPTDLPQCLWWRLSIFFCAKMWRFGQESGQVEVTDEIVSTVGMWLRIQSSPKRSKVVQRGPKGSKAT